MKNILRSLTFKLTLAFVLIGLTGSLLVAVITRQRINTAFDQFVVKRDQSTLTANLTDYYLEHGSWAGVTQEFPSFLFNNPPLNNDFQNPDQQNNNPASNSGQPDNIPPQNSTGGFQKLFDPRHGGLTFTLVGADRKIVFTTSNAITGTVVSNQDLSQATSITANNQTVGWLLISPNRPNWTPGSPEGAFLVDVNAATLQSSLIAVILALFLGWLLALTMTRSLRELTEATMDIARGKLGAQVKVRTKDELGKLAESFNKMSHDLARAIHARRQMTADIAHDLRSPLSVLTGYTEALSDGKLPGTPEVYDMLYQETRHLNRLVDDLRTLSLADAGELPLNLQTADPRVILERVAARYAITAQNKDISLQVEAEPQLSAVNVDVERISQVFDNLVTNAFRYTSPGGKILLTAQCVDGAIKMKVCDNGSGISPQDLPLIFDRFYRGDKARQKSDESGLGLAIAKSIVEAHGGKIEVESAPGQGATFTISLKCQAPVR